MNVRWAVDRTEDLDTLARIERSAYPPRLRWSEEDLRSEVVQGHVMICEDSSLLEGKLMDVGYVAFKVMGDVGNINSVAVFPHQEGRGYGTRLVKEALARLGQQGVECVELDCDEKLVGFYMNFGFSVCGFYTTGISSYQTSRLVMRKTILYESGDSVR